MTDDRRVPAQNAGGVTPAGSRPAAASGPSRGHPPDEPERANTTASEPPRGSPPDNLGHADTAGREPHGHLPDELGHADTVGREPPHGYLPESDDRPGDPVCLLRRVCPACGSVADEDPPTICPTCRSPITAD